MDPGDVVVGVDGSESSWQALRWAAAEIRRGDGRLRVVLAYRRHPASHPPRGDASDEFVEAQARGIVDRAVAEAAAGPASIAVTGTAVPGNPTVALLAASARARVVVVGSRGRGGFTSLLLGSVGLQVATHARCSVGVIRGRTDARTGPVVVGINSSATAGYGAGVAFEHAAARGCGLVAAHVYAKPTDDPEHALHPFDGLIAAVAAWRDKYPQVSVEYLVLHGHPGPALAGLSHRAQLVVVGARGIGGFTGLLLGSTSQHLIHHADCPVLIARSHGAD